MSQTNYCANCEARDRPTHYEGGTVCRTCCLFTDLHVATHYIRIRQPSMLTILDGALSDARTLAHRIMDYDNQKSTAAGISNEHQLQEWDGRNWVLLGMDRGKCPLGAQQPEEVEPQAIADQGAQLHSDHQGQQRSIGSNASVQDHVYVYTPVGVCALIMPRL